MEKGEIRQQLSIWASLCTCYKLTLIILLFFSSDTHESVKTFLTCFLKSFHVCVAIISVISFPLLALMLLLEFSMVVLKLKISLDYGILSQVCTFGLFVRPPLTRNLILTHILLLYFRCLPIRTISSTTSTSNGPKA